MSNEPSMDKESSLEFKIPWEDKQDVYKQNSPSAIKMLTEQPRRERLGTSEENMLQMIGCELDRTTSFDEIIGAPKRHHIPGDVKEQIDRLPSWLQAMVISKYSRIHNQYKENTAKFFRAIANRIDKKYRARLKSGGNEDAFVIRGEGDRRNRTNLNTAPRPRTFQESYVASHGNEAGDKGMAKSTIAVRMAHAATRWRRESQQKPDDELWRPTEVSRANLKLRSALQTRAAYSDLATVAEDEDMLKVDEKVMDSDDEENQLVVKKNYWDKIFDREEAMLQAEKQVEKDLTRRKKLTVEEKARIKAEKKAQAKLKPSARARVGSFFRHVGRKTQEHFFVSKHGKRRKKRKLLAKGYFRDNSRLFHKACGTFRKTPKRLEKTYRCDESFHNYCVALVSWTWFKAIIMAIIGINAIVLAVETGSFMEEYSFYFEIIDLIFVAIYTVEFIVKIYAHPYRYWRSGFNVFDFVILMISLIKNIIDWTNLAVVDELRALLIVRALRILRGISFSVQLQVLVTALVETIKTHVLSVVILLVLLLYVIAIVAFYFFGASFPEAFGTVGLGMLNMLRVLTIDGWTDLNEDLTKRVGVGGTIFIIACIVLGNFLFSNIFVAIIIMNISEATDNFRDKQREQRDTVVRLKKEKVYRRQKLDLRQLFARQRTSAFTDFFSIGGQFQKLLRHDDLVAMADVVTSPLWIDSVYQSMLRANQTSNVLMNLHREMADNMLDVHRHYQENKAQYEPIARARYNRYLRVKAKFALLKQEILETKSEGVPRPALRIRLPSIS